MTRNRTIVVVVAFAGMIRGEDNLEPLPQLLERAGQRVELFSQYLSSVSCTEAVRQVKLTPDGKTATRREARYSYVSLLQVGPDGVAVEESREALDGPPKAPAQPLLVAGGFSMLALVLHPIYQGSYVFRDEEPDAAGLRRISFEAVRGSRSPSALELRGKDYPIEWKGFVWLEPKSAEVVRVSSTLSHGMEDIGLRGLSADVRYEAHVFRDPPATLWLPATVSVEAFSRGSHWKNTQQYMDCRRFSVQSDVKTSMTNGEGTKP